MAKLNDLTQIKSFLAAEQQQIANLTAPEDFSEQIRNLVADYDLREQTIADTPAPLPQLMPLPQPRRRLDLRLRKRRQISPAFFASVAVAALIICAIGLTLPGSFGASQYFSGLIEIKAAYAADGGIDANQGFIINASQPLSAELVEKALQVYPNFEYQLQEEDASTYRVLPTQPLSENTVYHLSFDPERVQEDKPVRAEYSWSFQTEAAFALVDSSPTDTAQEVPATAALVLNFNKDLSPEAAAFVEIEPQLNGAWHVEKNTLYFLPELGWDYDTIYTVRVAAELPAADGTVLEQGCLSRFQTEPPPLAETPFTFSLGNQNASGSVFAPGEIPAWPLEEQKEADDSPYNVEIYALPDMQHYAALLDGSADDSEELPLWAAYEIAAAEDVPTLALPATLPPGFYIAHVSKQGCLRPILFQVSELNAYIAYGEADRLFWLHDSVGRPVADADIRRWPDGAEQGKTDQDGLAVLTADKEAGRRPIYCIETEQEALVVAVCDAPQPSLPLERHSYFLYTNQQYYAPGQTVNFFGACESNYGEEERETEFSVRLKGVGAESQALPYTVAVDNVFSGSLTLPGLRDGWYELAMYAGESYLGGCYIQVGPPEEQLYYLSVRPAAEIAMAGEPVEWLVEARYGEDIPLAGLEMLVEDVPSGLSLPLTTDEAGQAVLALPAAQAAGQEVQITQELRVMATFPGQGQTIAAGSLSVLQYDAFIDAVAERSGPASYNVQLIPVSLTIPASGNAEAARDVFSGDMIVSATLIRHDEALAAQDEAAEQEIANISAPEFSLKLVNGQPLFHEVILPQPGDYSLLLSAKDKGGRAFTLEVPLPAAAEDASAQPLLLKDTYLLAGEAPHYYAPAEQIDLRLYRGNALLRPAEDSRSLFVLAGERILASSIGTETSSSLYYEHGYPSGFYGWAVYFADGNYYESEPLPLAAEQNEAVQLELEWTQSDEDNGTERVSLRLSDELGQPLAASLNVNLLQKMPPAAVDVDFGWQGGAADFAYRHLFSHGREEQRIPAGSSAPRQPQSTPPATADTAASGLFVTVKTDARGRAELEFQPPQDGKIWAVRWHAYSEESGLSASGLAELDLRPEFGLLYRFDEAFMAGDAPVIQLNATGTMINDGDEVSYEISLAERNHQHSFKHSLNGLAGQWQEIPLAALPVGEYELQLTAAGNSYIESRLLRFTVRQSMNNHYVLIQQPLTAGHAPMAGGDETVTLIFSDKEQAAVAEELFALTGQDTVALEQKLAALTAFKALEQHFGWQSDEIDYLLADLMLYQREDGGLAPLPRAAADKKFSALVASLAKDGVNQAALAAYLRTWYEQAEQDVERAMALYGLAGLEQPVLLDIERMMAEQPSSQARIYLALGYFACGNGAAAKELAQELLVSHSEGLADGSIRAAHIDGADEGLLREATAQLALLANVFDLPHAEGLYAYLRACEPGGTAQTLAQALILAARCYSSPPNAYFSYRLGDGPLQQIRLREHGRYSLTLPSQQLDQLVFSDVAGDVVLSMISCREGLPPAENTEQTLHIERLYQQQAQDIVIGERGLVQVRLNFSLPQDAPAGYYRIDDVLPAGLHFCALDSNASSRRVWLLADGGSTVSFNVYKGDGAFSGSVVYTARVHMPGSYSAEAPYMYAVPQPEIMGVGEQQQVEIK